MAVYVDDIAAPSLRLLCGTCYVLCLEDQRWAAQAGRERRRLNFARGSHLPLVDQNPDPLDVERLACGAEIAFARLVRVRPTLVVTEGWWNQPNGYLPNGHSYDVVHTPRQDGRLLVPVRTGRHKPRRDFWYMLIISRWPAYEFRGWLPGELLIRYDRQWNPRGPSRKDGWCYTARQQQLRSLLEYW